MAMTLITTNTPSNAASSSFTSGIDSTYKLYIFKFYDVNPATDDANLGFDGSVDGGSNYAVTKTTTLFLAEHDEAGGTGLGYRTSEDVAQGTGDAILARGIGNGGDQSCAGTIWLFNPSSTTYVTHFCSTVNSYVGSDAGGSDSFYAAGYFNTTDNIDAVQFAMSSGNFDGTIKMYGVG